MKKVLLILLFALTAGNSFGQMVLTNYAEEPHEIITNDETVEKIIDEFFDAASYYRVDFVPGLKALKSVKLAPGDLNFIGSNRNGEITINDKLLRYPNLMRWVLFNQLGQHYGLKLENTDLRIIMTKEIEMSARFEFYAEALRIRGVQKRKFFEKLENSLPLTHRI